MLFLAALALASAHPMHHAPSHHASAAKATDWSLIANATREGGFVMGNPAAKVKLVEYGSLTCPHCRHFDEEGVTPLIANYVRGGQVSYEYRSFLLNGIDIPATLIASCNGARNFFAMLRALYATQPQWVAKIKAISAARMIQIQGMTPAQQFSAVGVAAGFPQIAAAHGIQSARAMTCLADRPGAEALATHTADAANRLNVKGTPTFIVNGTTVDYSGATSVWGAVDAKLAAALRG